MSVFLSLVLLVGGFILLAKGAEWLVEGSSSLARRFGVPAMVVGLTIVAFGTSLPEFMVSLLGSFLGSPDISVGTIVGSNIINIAVILGLCAVISPIIVKEGTLIYEFPFIIVSALFLLILANDNNIFGQNTFTLGRFDGILLLFIFIIFLFYLYYHMKDGRQTTVEKEFETEYKTRGKVWKNSIYILLGVVALFAGGRMLVYAAVDIATLIGMSEKFIGLTVVALGTSLPELFTSIIAIRKKESEIAIGNIIGSNIFNILWVLGLVSVITPLVVNPVIVYFDMIIMIGFSLLLVFFATTGKKITRWEGFVFIGTYAIYLTYLIMLR